MSMLKSKVAKVAVIFMAVAMTIVPLNAFAETQIKRPTFQGQTVLCTLECTFHPIDDDEGLAMTAWYGKKGYSVKTVLWQCQTMFSDYKKLGVKTAAKKAKVQCYCSDVWKFMSNHYGRVGNNDKHNDKLVAITDW